MSVAVLIEPVVDGGLEPYFPRSPWGSATEFPGFWGIY